MQIAPGIYDIGPRSRGYFKAGYSKAYMVDDGEGLIVIDTLYDADAALILEEIERIGRSERDIKYILLTHAHRGHLGGLDRLKQLSDAPIYSHPWEADIVAGDRPIQAVDKWNPKPLQTWPIIFIGELTGRFNRHIGRSVDVLIEDGDAVGPLRALHTPGHTPGHLVFYWPERRALFTGDTFVTWPLVCPGWSNSTLNEKQAWESLDKLTAIDVEMISPGHGNSILRDGSAVLSGLAARRKDFRW